MLKKLAIFSLLVSTTGMAISMPKNLEIKGGIGTFGEIYKDQNNIKADFVPELKADVLYGEEVYKINDKNSIVVKAGVDLGLGYEKFKDIKEDVPYNSVFTLSTQTEKGTFTTVDHVIVINSDIVAIPQVKTDFEKFSIRNGVKLGLGVTTSIGVEKIYFDSELSKDDYKEVNVEAEPAAITSYVFGADYKNIVMDLELGARHVFKGGYRALPIGSIKVGYKF